MQRRHQVGAVAGGKEPVSVNPDCSMAYLIESSRLLMKRLSSPERVPTAAATGLWGMAEGGAGPGPEDNEPCRFPCE